MRLITHRKVFRSFRRAGRCFFPGWRCDKSDSHSIHFPPTVLVLSQSPSPSFCAVHASPLSLPGPFLKANFPRRWNAPLPSPSSRSGLIEIEMLLPSFPSNLCRSTRRLQTSPACYPIYPSSLFSSHWLLMSSQQFVASKSPSHERRGEKKTLVFFPSPSMGSSDWTCVGRHYALAHNPRRECLRVAVFNQTLDSWDDYSRQITSSASNRGPI